MRELYIKNGQGFILVYSVTNQSSLRELYELREQIIRIKDNANVPMVLVANKSDLESERQVSSEMGVQVANSWGRTPFYETSAKYRLNVDEVFTDLVRQIMRRDSAFGGSVAPSLRGHSFHSSIDEPYYYGHNKRISASSNHSSVSGISTNTVYANLTANSNNLNNNNNNNYNYNITSPNSNNTLHHASSMFKLKSKTRSKEQLPRLHQQQELSSSQMQQLRHMEQQQNHHLQQQRVQIAETEHKLTSKMSRQFKKQPQPSKSMPALRKSKKTSLLSGREKEKDCVIC